MIETIFELPAGPTIEIAVEYMGDEGAPFAEENTNRNEVTMRVDDAEATFDIWGSPWRPSFAESEDDALFAAAALAGDALDYIQDACEDIVLSDKSPQEIDRIVRKCRDLAIRFEELGLREDDLIELANSNR